MNQDKNQSQQIINDMAELLGIQPADLDFEASINDDLGLNPVEKADLYSGLSRKYHISFDPEDRTQIETVNDLVEVIEDKLLEA